MEQITFDQLPAAVLKLFNKVEDIERLLLSRQSSPAPEGPGKPMTVSEAAKFLSLKPATIYQMVSRNEIPYSKPNGQKLYFYESELTDWLKGGRKKTVAELATDSGNVLRKGPKKKGAR